MGQKEAAKQKRQETEQMDCIYEKKHNNICERLEESKTAVFKQMMHHVSRLSYEDSATKQEFIICVQCVFSGVKFSFVVQECGLLLSPLQCIVNCLIVLDLPYFQETPHVFGGREHVLS